MIYLDNNATTMMHSGTIKEMVHWCNRGNPSSGYASAKAARLMMDELRSLTGAVVGVKTCCKEPRDGGKPSVDPTLYKVILTSGASEANAMIIRSVVAAYRLAKNTKPHIITSTIEHKSVLTLLEQLEREREVTVTWLDPSPTGHISAKDVESSIMASTCMATIMHANNETGAINDIARIAGICHKNNVVFHSDTVQSYGKIPFDASLIDSFSVSYHKLGGPPGVGCLVVKQALLNGYKLNSMIAGTQNEGLRGGTENVPGFGAALAAMKHTFNNHATSMVKVAQMKTMIMTELQSRGLPHCLFKNYDPDGGPSVQLVFLSNDSEYYLPNTILVALVKKTGKPVCNVEMKDRLYDRGIIVSVGSACNTSSSKASHVLSNMGVDTYIKKGALRISLSPDNTIDECKKFIKEYLTVCVEQIKK
jgi:cysteine desulfurase